MNKKISHAVTDSGKEIKFDDVKKPGIANLMRIYGGITNKEFADIESEFRGKSYSQFKEVVAKALITEFKSPRAKKTELMKNPKGIRDIFAAGSKKAREHATQKMIIVKKAIGLP